MDVTVVYHIICRILLTLFVVLLRVAYLSKRVIVVASLLANAVRGFSLFIRLGIYSSNPCPVH